MGFSDFIFRVDDASGDFVCPSQGVEIGSSETHQEDNPVYSKLWVLFHRLYSDEILLGVREDVLENSDDRDSDYLE